MVVFVVSVRVLVNAWSFEMAEFGTWLPARVRWFRLAGGLRPVSALLRLRAWWRRGRGSPFLKGFPFICQGSPGAWFRVVANSQYLPGSSG